MRSVELQNFLRRPSGARHRPPLLEAFPAKNRAPLAGTEWHRGLLAAMRTNRRGFHLGVGVRGADTPHHRNPLVFARLAAFGFVFKLFIVEKELFTRREDKLCSTINTLQYLVLELHRENAPFD